MIFVISKLEKKKKYQYNTNVMKNLYTTLVLVLVTITTFSQDKKYRSNNTVVLYDQVVAIRHNQILSMEEAIVPVEAEEKEAEFRYYYLPNMYAYFDVQTNKYIYKENNNWKTSTELPKYYGGYSSFKNLRVPLKTYTGSTPQLMLNDHKKEFPYVKNSTMAKALESSQNKALSSVN